jgi:hypothetical protein
MFYEIGYFFLGLITGIAIVRYGIGLGTKMYVKADENKTLDEKDPNITEQFTR